MLSQWNLPPGLAELIVLCVILLAMWAVARGLIEFVAWRLRVSQRRRMRRDWAQRSGAKTSR